MNKPMTNQEALNMMSAFQQVSNLPGLEFADAVARNRRTIQAEYEHFMGLIKPSGELTVYYKALEMLESELSKADDDGKIKCEGKIKALKDKNKKLIDDQQEKVDDLNNNLMAKKFKPELVKVEYKDVPKNITPAQYDGLFFMIEKKA